MDEEQILNLNGAPVTIPVLNWIINTLEEHGSVKIINAYKSERGGTAMTLGMELQKALSVLEAAHA